MEIIMILMDRKEDRAGTGQYVLLTIAVSANDTEHASLQPAHTYFFLPLSLSSCDSPSLVRLFLILGSAVHRLLLGSHSSYQHTHTSRSFHDTTEIVRKAHSVAARRSRLTHVR